MRNIDRKKINSYIMALYIFQFGFLQPIASLINSQIPIAAFTMLLLIAVLMNNKLKIKSYVVIAFVAISIYFLLNLLVMTDSRNYIILTYIEFILKGFSAFIIASIPVRGEELYNTFMKLSVLNFVAIIMYPFTNLLNSMNYMRFGYAMVPSTIMFLYASYDSKFKRPIWIVLMLLSLFTALVYGSRGSLVVILVFMFFILINLKDLDLLKKATYISLFGLLIYISIEFQVPIKIIDYINIDMGINSYALNKIKFMLTDGLLASSSGRDGIYSNIISIIKNKPMIGNGISVIQYKLNLTAHNIILQILVESGVIGLLTWILIWISPIKKYIKLIKKNRTGYYRIITMLFAIVVGRLLVSSDMWLRPEYWFLLSILIGIKTRNKYNFHREVS